MPKKSNPKLERALMLLRQGNNCKTVAEMIGYTIPGFHLAFKKYYGKTPGSFIETPFMGKDLDIVKLDLFLNSKIYSAINEKSISEFLNIKLPELKSAFLERKGISLSNYIDEKKLDEVLKLMKEGHDNQLISKVMNFPSIQSFKTFIRTTTGHSLTAYRKKLWNGSEIIPNYEIDKEFEEVKLYIKKYIHQPKLPVNIKKQFRIPIWLLEKRFNTQLNISLTEYILEQRMALAKSLLLKNISLELITEKIGYDSSSKLIVDIRRYYKEEADQLISQESHKTPARIFQLFHKYVLNNLAGEISVNKIASFFQLSREKVLEVFEENSHLNFLTYIRQLRVETAIKLLNEGEELEEVIIKVGYSNILSLRQSFRQSTGKSLHEFMKQLKGSKQIHQNRTSTKETIPIS